MYKLKDEWKGATVIKNSYQIYLDNVKSEEVEILGIEYFFTKGKEKKSKPTD